MIFEFDENTRMVPADHYWTIELRVTPTKGKHKGIPRWEPTYFYATLAQAARDGVERHLKAAELSTLSDAMDEIRAVCDRIENEWREKVQNMPVGA